MVSVICAILLCSEYLTCTIYTLFFQDKFINSYGYIFQESDDRNTLGASFQFDHKCCGWNNASQPIITQPQCSSSIPCRNIIKEHVFDSSKPTLVITFASGSLIFAYAIFGAFRIYQIHKHPYLPDYDQRLNPGSKDDLIF